MDNRVELCCHTKMSELQGLNEAKEYIKEAVARGYDTIAITDTNSTQAFLEVYEYFKLWDNNEKLKIIYGAEMFFKENENTENTYSIFIYIKEQKGLKNLYKLVSSAYKNIIDGNPTLYKEELNKYRDGLLYASIGNKSEIYRRVYDKDIINLIKYYDFIGIEPAKDNKNRNIEIAKLCNSQNKMLIGASNCNFINKEDSKFNEILNSYKNLKNLKEGNERYFHTTEELIKELDYIENIKDIIINNTNKIAEKVEDIDLMPTRANYPIIPSSERIIVEKCKKRAHELYGEKLSKKIEYRMKLELDSILENNFQNIYLIASDLVKKSNELGYKVGNRGSVGNSFVAYLLGITNIDPIKYDLPFEFFVGENYNREPDIDLNFSSKIQNKMFEYLQKRFGKDKIIWGGTTGTLADRTVSNIFEKIPSTNEIDLTNLREDAIKKITGIKRCTGEHPGGIFIVPKENEIIDFCPTEVGENSQLKTHPDYHSLWSSGLYKFDILGHNDPTMIYELEKETNTNSNDIKLDDKETLKMFLHANDKSYPISTDGIPEFGTTFVKKMIEISKPRNFNDLVCISALSHGTGTWTYNATSLIEKEHKRVDEVISNREDMFNYLVKNGIEKNVAFDIVEFVRKGKASKGRDLWKHNRDRYKELNEKWSEYKTLLKDHNIPEWYIEDAEKIKYMFPKAHAIGYTMNAFKIAWYKVYYPKAFYKVYFKIKSDLNLSDYYCKRQVATELKRLYDLKEIHDNNMEFDYDYSNNDKIKDLELILEMFNRGILKEKAEIKDDYNLINSRVIADYCRNIKHKFNTEELAVLVYRNQRMSIEEKIAKYNDLIKNYPDMEVIERINCKHYDSVKTMIKKEIQRIKILNKKLIQDDKNSIYTWTEYNKSTQKYEHSGDVEHTFRSYKETFKDIQDYIKEYDDTISFRITKKYFDKRKEKIFADYNVKNKKAILVDIVESNKGFFDIDQIFLNIPTPFKKGDILISNSPTMKSYGDNNDIFVLEYLCTWRKNLSSYLADGNYDSSDMIGYGYYFINDDTTEFVRDHKWNYDSFEYYDGELTGRNRILKNISSFIKGKIDLELFVHAYDVYKTEFKNEMPNFYTDEGLKLAGMTDTDVQKTNHREHEKIYNWSDEEKENWFKWFTCIYEKVNKNEIKQIETDFDNNIYVLASNGNLYKTAQYDNELEFISNGIEKIFYLDGMNLYRITTENEILPIENNKDWNNTDKYLNNDNCKYKKIETSKMHIVLLTEEGNVRALCGGYPSLGIIPDNFVNVEDITIVEDENGVDMPYIYKNNEFIELYIE